MSTERSGIKPDHGIEKDYGWITPRGGGGSIEGHRDGNPGFIEKEYAI